VTPEEKRQGARASSAAWRARQGIAPRAKPPLDVKAHRAANFKAWAAKNRDRILVNKKRFYAAHSEQRCAEEKARRIAHPPTPEQRAHQAAMAAARWRKAHPKKVVSDEEKRRILEARRERERATTKQWRDANTAKVRANKKAWYDAHPGHGSETKKKWVAANKGSEKYKARARASAKKSAAAHPERVRATKKRWNAANPDKVRAMKARDAVRNAKQIADRLRKWERANAEKVRIRKAASTAKRRSRLEGIGDFTLEEWTALLDATGRKCLLCGVPETDAVYRIAKNGARLIGRLTVDHVIPLSKGGRGTIDNIGPLCLPCNMRKHTKHIDYREKLAASTDERRFR
jgi:5-methylcytosine-specific restriction endonuclease McrA